MPVFQKLYTKKTAELSTVFLFVVLSYTTPCAIIASATFSKPAMFAPMT